jgi:myo-inositol 2-dehydrogenase/D-chiro-inositol 1-dehydrogenase
MSTQEAAKTISVGVIGTGLMGTRHAVNLHRLIGGAKVGGIFEVDAGRAAAASALCGGAPVFTDPMRLINDTSIDALLIASPDNTHASMTLACLNAGKPVLCEKPLATSVEDAVKVLNTEVALGRRLVSVGFMRRFDPYHVAVKNAALTGDLGKPLLWKGVHRNAAQAYGVTGATILTNSAGHDFDSARWLLGEEVQEVYVRGLLSRPELHPDTRDMLLIELFMTNNTMGTAEVYVNDDYGYEVSAELVCQKGTAVTTQPDKALIRKGGNRGVPVSADWLNPFQDAYVAEALDWIEGLQTGRAFKGASAWDGYVTMMVTAACIKSLHSCEVVPVKLIEKPGLYS